MDGIALLTIFILSIFVGFEVVSKVSTVLHTPLMSGANAIHGVVVMGAIMRTRYDEQATIDARRRIVAFFDKHLKAPSQG